MATIYQRCCIFTERTKWKFNKHKRNTIGNWVKNRCNELGLVLPYTVVESIEPDGTFQVRDYTEDLTPIIDAEIQAFFEHCISHKQLKKVVEKPTSGPKKKRTRKIIPAYTGKKT